MKEYEFRFKFRLPADLADPEVHEDTLFDNGCDDALIGVGQKGRIALDFCREAESAYDAIYSALTNVKAAIPGAELIEVTPDLVGLTDVAEIIGCSRQNVRKVMQNNQSSFPLPIHEGSASLWHLSPVLDWFRNNQNQDIDESLLEVASTTMKVNTAKELNFISDDLEEMRALVL